MPRILGPSEHQLIAMIRDLQRQVHTLATQPTISLADPTGTVRLQIGVITAGNAKNSSAPIYGIVVLNDDGTYQMQSGRSYAQTWGVVDSGLTGSGTFANFAVTATAGPSGQMDLEIWGLVSWSPSSSDTTGGIQLGVTCTSDSSLTDLAFATAILPAVATSPGPSVSIAAASTTGDLTPGQTYTFGATWQVVTGGGSWEVANLVLRAIPT